MTEPRTLSPGRKWLFRSVALLLPFALLGLLELAFRLTGVGAEDPWANHHVRYVSGERYFPGWADDIQMPKPVGTTRIFVFGGSCVLAAGAPPFPALLPRGLAARFPSRKFEVINGGVVAFGTHRVFEVMKEAAPFDPDLFILYTGHNEFLEDVFFDPDGFLARQERFSAAVSDIRVIRVLRGLVSDRPIEIPRPDIQRHFLGNKNFPLIRDEEQYRLRLEFTRSNVRQMCELAAAHGVPMLVLPAIPNYLWEPGDSIHGPGHDAAGAEWDARYDEGMSAWKDGRSEEAAAAFRGAAEIDGDHALLIHYLGLSDLELGRPQVGIERLLRAADLDRRGDRANSDVRETIRAAVMAAKQAHPAASFEIRDLQPRLVGFIPRDFDRYREDRDETIYVDHCHFSAEGHEVMARLIVGCLTELLAKD